MMIDLVDITLKAWHKKIIFNSAKGGKNASPHRFSNSLSTQEERAINLLKECPAIYENAIHSQELLHAASLAMFLQCLG